MKVEQADTFIRDLLDMIITALGGEITEEEEEVHDFNWAGIRYEFAIRRKLQEVPTHTDN